MKTIITLLALILSSNLFAQDINFDKINELYYNLNEYNFNGFSAEVEFDILEQFKKSIKGEKYISVVDNITLKIDFYSKDSIRFIASKVEETNNLQFDQGLAQAINGAEETIEGFLQSWSEITLVPAFEPEKHNYNIHTESGLTKINYEQEEADVVIYLDNMTNIDSMHFASPSAEIKIYHAYETTSFNKKIIKSIAMSINNFLYLKMDITYKDFDKIKIPQNVAVTQKMQGMSQELKFTFKNIVLL